MHRAPLRHTLDTKPCSARRKLRGERRAAISVLSVVVGVTLIATSHAADQTPQPQAETPKPGGEAVRDVTDVSDVDLQTPAFDRILLRDGTMHECEPLRPRPLPEMQGTATLGFQPLGGGETVKVFWRRVERVVYFEELLIEKANLLIGRRQFDEAFEYLQRVQRRAADWSGLARALERLLFEEAASLFESGRARHAVNLLVELRTRNPDYRDLDLLFDRGAEQLLAAAFRANDYRQVRWLIVHLDAQFPNRPPVQRWREQMIQLAQNRVVEALANQAEANEPQASALILEAARIWPELPSLNEQLARILPNHTVVRVAVQQLPEQFGSRLTTSAQRRASQLAYQSLVAPSTVPEPESYTLELAERYETSELGRRMTFEFSPGRKWSDGTTPISAMDAAYVLNRRSDPNDPTYDPKWVRLGPTVRIDGPLRFTVDFAVPPLRPEAWFQFPVVPQSVMSGRRRALNQSAVDVATGDPAASGPFFVHARSSSRVEFRANSHYQRDGAVTIHELVEEQIPDTDAALRALVRREVALLEHVPPFDVEKARGLPDVTVGRYAVPRVHLIALDSRTSALRVRALRRALVYAIDRETLLHDHLLGGAEAQAGAVSPGVLRRESSYANPSLRPRPYEPRLAAALVAHAEVQLSGSVPALKLHHPPDDGARLACRHIQAHLKAVGLEVQLVERTESALEQMGRSGKSLDLVYRIVTITEPIVDVPKVLAANTLSRDSARRVSSPWLRQLLVQLQQAPNVPAARALLMEIEQVVHDEVAVVPLWQIADYFAHDRRLSGIGGSPLQLYENVEQWRWEPTVLPDTFATTP